MRRKKDINFDYNYFFSTSSSLYFCTAEITFFLTNSTFSSNPIDISSPKKEVANNCYF